MKLHGIDWTPFRIPFRRPLRIAGAAVAARTGILLHAHGDNGQVGMGEVAPHPLAGDAGVRDAAEGIAKFSTALLSCGPIEIDPWLPDHLAMLLSTEARAGMEMACCDLAAQAAGIRVAQLLGGAVRELVPVNAIIDQPEPEAAAAAVRQRVAEGFQCLKLKVAHDLPGDLARVAAVREAAGFAVRIRIDANGVWSVDEAIAAIQRLAVHGIEYVEQPVREIEDLAQVRRAVETPIAADECVTGVESVERLVHTEAADIVVVKPVLLGLRTAAAIIHRARACGLRVVVTSALDTSLGIAAALHVAATLPDPALPCGLATASLLEGDLVHEPLIPHAGWLRLPSGPGLGLALDAEALQRWRCD